MYLLATGDGAIVRKMLAGLVEFLKRFVEPTGARGSILLMSGGLIILGFLFLTFLFKSAIVGDLAPTANARRPVPHVLLPDDTRRLRRRASSGQTFAEARTMGRTLGTTLDGTFDALREQGVDARILQSDAEKMRVRVYDCTCTNARIGCERERGLLVGAFETLVPGHVTVEEATCRTRGGGHCEFVIHHGAIARIVP